LRISIVSKYKLKTKGNGIMTFNQMVRKLATNAVAFMTEGEVAKAQACLELIAFIRERGYENLRGKVELSVDNS
jgi:hypothetical protein